MFARVRSCVSLLVLLATAGYGAAEAPARPPILFDVVIAELNWPIRALIAPSRAIKRGDFPLAGRLDSPKECADYLKYLDDLQTRERVKILTRPTLVTRDGQRTSYRFAGQRHADWSSPCYFGSVGVIVDQEEYGVQLSLLPVLLADGTLRIEVETKLSSNYRPGEMTFGPEVERVRLRTTAELRPGQTLVLAGPESRCESCGSAYCLRTNAPYDKYVLLITRRAEPATGDEAADSGYEAVRSLSWWLQERRAEVEAGWHDVETDWGVLWWRVRRECARRTRD